MITSVWWGVTSLTQLETKIHNLRSDKLHVSPDPVVKKLYLSRTGLAQFQIGPGRIEIEMEKSTLEGISLDFETTHRG